MLDELLERHGQGSVTLLALGAVCLLASMVAPWLFGGRLAWNDEMAVKFQQAAANYHDALHQRGHGKRQFDVSKLKQAQSDYEQLQRQLDGAQSGGTGTASFLRWAGGVLCVIGIGLSWRRRAQES